MLKGEKEMKKILSIFMSTIMIALTITQFSIFASAKEQFTYIKDDGTEINYYLDENGMPYNYRNGEKIYLIIPIEGCIITEEELIKELNEKLEDVKSSQNQITRAAPTNYYSLRQNDASVTSNVYTKAMNLAQGNGVTTYLYKHSSHPVARVRTANLTKPSALASKKVTITLYAYVESSSVWVKSTLTGIDATAAVGKGFELTTDNNYFFVQVTQYKDAVSFNINVWTTLYW